MRLPTYYQTVSRRAEYTKYLRGEPILVLLRYLRCKLVSSRSIVHREPRYWNRKGPIRAAFHSYSISGRTPLRVSSQKHRHLRTERIASVALDSPVVLQSSAAIILNIVCETKLMV